MTSRGGLGGTGCPDERTRSHPIRRRVTGAGERQRHEVRHRNARSLRGFANRVAFRATRSVAGRWDPCESSRQVAARPASVRERRIPMREESWPRRTNDRQDGRRPGSAKPFARTAWGTQGAASHGEPPVRNHARHRDPSVWRSGRLQATPERDWPMRSGRRGCSSSSPIRSPCSKTEEPVRRESLGRADEDRQDGPQPGSFEPCNSVIEV